MITTTGSGKRAESAAAAFLQMKGCSIIGRNWRTRWCEIDIIAQRNGTVYFCEVKYRRNSRQGYGFDYITDKKRARMKFAAELWISEQTWDGACELCAIEVAGPEFTVVGAVKDGLS